MEKIDSELETILAENAPESPVRVILQAGPTHQAMDRELWTRWARDTFIKSAAKATGMEASSLEIMPNLKTMVITAPSIMVRQFAEAPETQSIRLQPADDNVEFFQPVK